MSVQWRFFCFSSPVGICVFFYFTIFVHFHNLYQTLQCTVRQLIDTIGVFTHLRVTTEQVFTALIKLKFTIIFIAQMISALLPNYYNAKQHGECELFKCTYLVILNFKAERYNCIAHRSAHLSITAISSHSHIKRKQP